MHEVALPPTHVAIFWFTPSPHGGGLIIRNYVTAGNAPRLTQTKRSTYEIKMEVPVREYVYMYSGVAHAHIHLYVNQHWFVVNQRETTLAALLISALESCFSTAPSLGTTSAGIHCQKCALIAA